MFASKSHFNGFLVDLGAQGFSQVLLNASRGGFWSPKGLLNKSKNRLKRIQHRSRNCCLPGNRILIDVGWIWVVVSLIWIGFRVWFRWFGMDWNGDVVDLVWIWVMISLVSYGCCLLFNWFGMDLNVDFGDLEWIRLEISLIYIWFG